LNVYGPLVQIALFSDVHFNLPALAAVFDDIAAFGVEHVRGPFWSSNHVVRTRRAALAVAVTLAVAACSGGASTPQETAPRFIVEARPVVQASPMPSSTITP
jgi:hypothetical protein